MHQTVWKTTRRKLQAAGPGENFWRPLLANRPGGKAPAKTLDDGYWRNLPQLGTPGENSFGEGVGREVPRRRSQRGKFLATGPGSGDPAPQDPAPELPSRVPHPRSRLRGPRSPGSGSRGAGVVRRRSRAGWHAKRIRAMLWEMFVTRTGLYKDRWSKIVQN